MFAHVRTCEPLAEQLQQIIINIGGVKQSNQRLANQPDDFGEKKKESKGFLKWSPEREKIAQR